jgi:hypothetical protein
VVVIFGAEHADDFLERKTTASALRKLRKQENNRVEIDLQSTGQTKGNRRRKRQAAGRSRERRARTPDGKK